MTAVLVRESNPHSRDPEDALLPFPPGCAGHRLMRLLGLTPVEYLWRFRRANLLPTSRWSTRAARLLLEARGRGCAVVALGRRVAAAFAAADAPFFTRHVTDDGDVVYVLPHPSGRCREWNDPAAPERARRLLAGHLG